MVLVMETIGAFEAKTHFSALLERVARGEDITITRRGVPTAMLVPFKRAKPKRGAAGLLKEMRKIRERGRPGIMSIREMINEGRRF